MIVKVTSPSFSKNGLLKQELREKFPSSVFNDQGLRYSKDELIHFLRDADAAIIGLEHIDSNVLDACPNLKMISKYGVGLNNLDLPACKKRNVQIGWTGGVNKLSAAEMTLGFMIALSRNLFRSSFRLKSNEWKKEGGYQLTGKTVGIIGVGHIGKEVVRLLEPFKTNILVNDIINQDEYYNKNGLVKASKETIYKQADIITVHTPLTKKTKHLINREVFAMMQPSSFIINCARGPIINQSDLKFALMESSIAGAALDVYEDEPPSDIEFLQLPNLICTPHIGGNSQEAVLAMGRSAIAHLISFRAERLDK